MKNWKRSNVGKSNATTFFLLSGLGFLCVAGCGYGGYDWDDEDFTFMTHEMYLANTVECRALDGGGTSRKKGVFYFIRRTDTGDTMSGCCIWADDGETVKIVYGMGTKQILKGREAIKWWYNGDMEWFTDRNEWQMRLLQLEK